MNIDMSIGEVMDLLLDGSTNQKQFMADISESGNNLYEVFGVLEDLYEEKVVTHDLRSLLNGGALKFEELTDFHKEYYMTHEFNNGYGLVFY